MDKLNGKLANFQESVRLYYVAIARRKQGKIEIEEVRNAQKNIAHHGQQYEDAAREQELKTYDIMKALDAAEERGLEESRK